MTSQRWAEPPERDTDGRGLHRPRGAVRAVDLRLSLSAVPTPVAIVTTTDQDDNPVGCLIGSFVAMSWEPPLVGFFGMDGSRTSAEAVRSGRFCVNFLAADESGVLEAFRLKNAGRFDSQRWSRSASGNPVLNSAVATFDCAVHSSGRIGDHNMIIGMVVGTSVGEHSAAPAIYAHGKFGVATGPIQGH